MSDRTERDEIRETRVTAAENKTKATKALENHRQLLAALDAAEGEIRRARGAAMRRAAP